VQVPVLNFRRVCDDQYQQPEQPLVYVAIADNEVHGCAKNVDLVVKAEQPLDVAVSLVLFNQEVSSRSMSVLSLRTLSGQCFADRSMCVADTG